MKHSSHYGTSKELNLIENEKFSFVLGLIRVVGRRYLAEGLAKPYGVVCDDRPEDKDTDLAWILMYLVGQPDSPLSLQSDSKVDRWYIGDRDEVNQPHSAPQWTLIDVAQAGHPSKQSAFLNRLSDTWIQRLSTVLTGTEVRSIQWTTFAP